MVLNELELLNFKNFSQRKISLNANFIAFTGKNGIGKTSILDAIHYLALTKSYINLRDKYNINFNSDFFLIKANFKNLDEEYNLQLLVKEGSKKVVKKNNKPYTKISEHIGFLKTVVISPYDRDLIWEGSSVRRKFLDQLISQLDAQYLQHLIRYTKVLNQRNSLLKYFLLNNTFDEVALEAYNQELIETGNYIYIKRKEIVEELQPIFEYIYKQISQNNEEVTISYLSDLQDNTFQNLFKESLQEDKRSGYTQKGIHKDDILLSLYNNPVKRTASQGQQKTFLIALKLAQVEYLKQVSKQNPILLLDDIFDKLDENRVQHLVQLIEKKNFGQVFISDTDTQRIKNIFLHLKYPTQIVEL